MAPDDLHYFRARAAEERQRASVATDPNVREVHLDLAKRYEAASKSQKDARQLQDSLDAISRSLALLSGTNRFASD